MKNTYTKANFRAHLELLKPQGFTLNSDEIYEKTITNGKIFLYIEADEHFPHSAIFGQVMIGIRFTNVENIFKQVCIATSNAVYSADDDDDTFGRGFGKSVIGETNFRSLYDYEVEDDHSFQIIRPLLEQMIAAAVSWANQNDTLQKAYDNAEALSFDARSDLYSQPFSIKYLIVKKLLNISDYSSYTSTLITNAGNRGETSRVSFLTTLKAILDAL